MLDLATNPEDSLFHNEAELPPGVVGGEVLTVDVDCVPNTVKKTGRKTRIKRNLRYTQRQK